MEILGSGIIQYVSKDLLIASKGTDLYCSYNSGGNWEKWCELPVSVINSMISPNRWLSRFTRKEVHHLIEINDRLFACFAFGEIYLIEKEASKVESIGKIRGSRPLKVCSDGECLYYGVYTRNNERKSVDLYSYSFRKKKWSVVYTFNNIRHIHGVFWDNIFSNLWVTTGDSDHEAAIWKINEGGNPEKVAAGSQQTRAVDLLFTEESIFFATDAPQQQNYIYRLNRKSWKAKKLQAVGGPVFYGRKEGGLLFFSTVVEPSAVNRTDAVELWVSSDHGDTWRRIKEFQKDFGNMGLFQYGQIKFPNGPGDGVNLWFTPYATEYDHQIMRMSLKSI